MERTLESGLEEAGGRRKGDEETARRLSEVRIIVSVSISGVRALWTKRYWQRLECLKL